jgi:hypothetical protein
MIQPLPGKNNYSVYTSMKTLLSLCRDTIASLQDNMLLHKAAKSADFEDTFTAHVSTSHVVEFPSVFGHKLTSGDSTRMIWNQGYKSHAACDGGMKSGGKTSNECKLCKVAVMVQSQINCRIPAHKFPMQHAVASAMLDMSSLACFDSWMIGKFYVMMVSPPDCPQPWHGNAYEHGCL